MNKPKHIMELPTNVPRLKEGSSLQKFAQSLDGIKRKRFEREAKSKKESKFHDDGAAKSQKELEDSLEDKKSSGGKFTGKEYMPVFPTYDRGQKITNVPGLSTKSTKDTIRTYTGKEYSIYTPTKKNKKKLSI
tara:strand:+ start:1244 stop:1642 length:399 start_codon:yes stop_codon:yes gene_type:complete